MAGALYASQAGRVSENGTGALWIAPELVGPASAFAQTCSQPTIPVSMSGDRELVFERLQPAEFDADENARLLASATREVVNFEWHPATGELSYDTSAPTGVFIDLAVSSRVSARSAPSCGSR